MWAMVVVVVLPGRRQPPGRCQALELFHGQELVPEPAVEALRVAVLPRCARLDVQRLHVDSLQPLPNGGGDELRAVVAADAARNAAHRKQLRQRVDHILARDAPVHLQGQALPRVLVHQRQPLQGAPAGRTIKHKVPAPDVVLLLGFAEMAAVLAAPQSPLLPLLLRDFQPFPTPQAIHPRVARLPAFGPKQPADPAIAEPRTLLRQLQHPLGQSRLVVARLRLVALRAAWLIDHLARSALRDLKGLLQILHGCPPSRRAYQFPSETCFSIWMSNAWSATICFRRLFSSSSSLSRLASSAFIPPYCFRQRRYVDSLSSRACSTTASSLPALSIASASRSFRTICSGVCRFRRLVVI